MIPKFLRNRHRYPELAIFPKMEYSSNNYLRIQEVPKQLLEMFNIYDHLPQVVIIICGIKEIGHCSKAQLQARSEDMLTDVNAMWAKIPPQPKIRLGIFVSLMPPMLWYEGFNNQKAGREACRSLNSHLGKVCKLVGATVVPHPHIKAEEKWFHDPRTDPTTLSEPAYDLFIQDLCLAITTKLQFSPLNHQHQVAAQYWHQQPAFTQDTAPLAVSPVKWKKRKNKKKK